jgi:hypothetical protein
MIRSSGHRFFEAIMEKKKKSQSAIGFHPESELDRA